jgi:hypothetical protein
MIKYKLSKDNFNNFHDECVTFIINKINEFTEKKKKIIVITHFPPIQHKTSHSKYEDQNEYLKNYYASNILLDEKINKHNIYWLYGSFFI